MKIATWNVNGIRARQAEVGELDRRASSPTSSACRRSRRPPSRSRQSCATSTGTGATGTAAKGYSGVALHVAQGACAGAVRSSSIPQFDHETRIVRRARRCRRASTGGVDLRPERRQGLRGQDPLSRGADRLRAPALPRGRARRLILCGDLNVARADIDVHPKERKPRAIGQRPEERALLRAAARRTGWSTSRAQLRSRQRRSSSPGGRPGATCASATSAGASTTSSPARRSPRARSAASSHREIGTSDHAPVVVRFEG